MDAMTDKTTLDYADAAASPQPSREEAEAAVRVLLRWAGENPNREGLIETPKRVVKAYEDWFRGYHEDPSKILGKRFEDVQGYEDMVMLTDIDVESHCEHHMAPILGTACVAYLPDRAVVGISKIAKVVEAFSKRLQTQETMTAQIADAIESAITPTSPPSPPASPVSSRPTPNCASASCACARRTGARQLSGLNRKSPGASPLPGFFVSLNAARLSGTCAGFHMTNTWRRLRSDRSGD
jgi:GTP cyclohydrolase I